MGDIFLVLEADPDVVVEFDAESRSE